jgi:hypothetical protein
LHFFVGLLGDGGHFVGLLFAVGGGGGFGGFPVDPFATTTGAANAGKPAITARVAATDTLSKSSERIPGAAFASTDSGTAAMNGRIPAASACVLRFIDGLSNDPADQRWIEKKIYSQESQMQSKSRAKDAIMTTAYGATRSGSVAHKSRSICVQNEREK